MNFEHGLIDGQAPGTENDVCLIADVNGNGFNDVVIGGKRGEGNIVWYEYPEWKRHTIGTGQLEAGGVMMDVNGNGKLDFVAGNPGELNKGKELYWFENPGEAGKEWTKRIITDQMNKCHDQAVGDIDNDGKDELVFLSNKNNIVGYYDIPADPTVSPWPEENRHIICDEFNLEGLAIADLDGDGKNELVAGPYWFKLVDGKWERHTIEESFRMTCVAVGDINGDGKPEVVLAEGESDPARLAWFGNAPKFDEVHMLAEDLFHPHSLAIGDMNGDGLQDIFVGEMGLGKKENPQLMVFVNKGNGEFEKTIIDEGKATHCAKIGDIGKSGKLSIVGKPYHPGQNVDLWLNKG